MSVIPMNLVTVAGLLDQFDTTVRSCVVDREFQPENAFQLMRDMKGIRPMEAADPYAPLLHQAEALAEQSHIPLAYAPFDREAELTGRITAYLDDLGRRVGELNDRQARLEQEAQAKRQTAGQLTHIQGLTEKVSVLRNMHFAKFRYGCLPRETYNSFQEAINAREDTFFFPTEIQPREVYGIYFTTRDSRKEVDAMFNSLHFVRITLDRKLEETAEEAVQRLTREAEEAEARRDQAAQALKELWDQERDAFLGYTAWLRYRSECCGLRRYAAQSDNTFYLTGWVPQNALADFRRQVGEQAQASCVVDSPDSVALEPPTKLKTSPLGRIYLPFLKMYGLPRYNELDPSLFMALTYTLFFGIMFGDLGQGLALAALGLFLYKGKGMWLGGIIACCGLSGAAFGCFYNSVFGFEGVLPWEGFAILEGDHVMMLLIASMVLGVGMLAFVMLLNIINGVRQRDFEKILFGPNGLAGMVFYLGIILAGVLTFLGAANLFTPAYVLPVLVLPILLILLKEPLSRLAAGKPDWYRISWGGLLSTGFFELFETVLSYLTNTLSFMRIGAYAITHVGLMMVIQMLAGSNLNPVVIVLGNVFVMGFEGLLVGIQVLRLEFYELFGRFYGDGGQAFQPKRVDYTGKSA